MKFNYSYLFLILLPFFLISCTQLNPEQEFGPLLEKYLVFWNTGKFQDVEVVLHPEFEIRMTPKYESEKGIDLFKENVTKWRTAYPDFHIKVKEKFFAENEAAAIWEITATNTGEGWHPPTKKSIKITGMSIFHFADGKIKDEWIASNNGYWMQQLGFKIISPFEE
jgi:predicted ester cyclase